MRYGAEKLGNGFVRVFDYASKSSYLIDPSNWAFCSLPPVQPYADEILETAKKAYAKYAPDFETIVKGGNFFRNVPVSRWILHPPGTHPTAPIVKTFHVLECVTEKGSRFYGVDGGEIDSHLRMRVWGGFVNARNELVRSWQDAA